ncbi:hypothetical protein AB0M41_30255 [Streptomyces sp. NPDC051896]|uniref:hypothetical protein n=1 Tax=Streptomyces sp. NPDC051896 TaxID=3155416 RepID=UPI00342A8C7F
MRNSLTPHAGLRPKVQRPSLNTRRAQFGIGNFAHALTFPGRLTGAVLIAVAFTTLLAAGAVLDHWVGDTFQYSGLVALIGVFAALLEARPWPFFSSTMNYRRFVEALFDCSWMSFRRAFGSR